MQQRDGRRRLARRLVESGQARHVRGVIVVDMVGDRDLNVVLPANSSPALCAKVFDAARSEGVRDRFALGQGGVLDDHVPFADAGMPTVDLIDFTYGSAPGLNDYWHTPRDTLDKLDPRSLEAMARVVLRLARDGSDKKKSLVRGPCREPGS